jgi:hypothetical protein
MVVGRNPRNAVIGDTVLLWADKRRGVGTIVDTDAIRYKVYWRNGRGPPVVACPRRVDRPPNRLRTAMAMTYLWLSVP